MLKKIICLAIFIPVAVARCVVDAGVAIAYACKVEYRALVRCLKGNE